jgi:hypothetical protein
MSNPKRQLRAADMTLRDYLAGVALPAVIDARIHQSERLQAEPELNQESIAEECYELADAMMDAREKSSDE